MCIYIYIILYIYLFILHIEKCHCEHFQDLKVNKRMVNNVPQKQTPLCHVGRQLFSHAGVTGWFRSRSPHSGTAAHTPETA